MPKERNSQPLNLATRAAYPFSAVVGQDEMKLALILNVIDPSVGGVLLLGHRGTGKSTVVRALADLLPPICVVARCPYHCDPADPANLCPQCSVTAKLTREQRAVPVVELPLGATEDRVCGTLDIEQALTNGVKRFEPGLLARANRGFLYIDEVNLLEDHLVDLLLDVAVTGVNKVERESISLEHPARFVLIGSGNPEEGELRPQLLDRFGLYVEVRTEDELDQRIEIVERRTAFERDAAAFNLRFAAEQEQLRRNINRARKSFAAVSVERAMLRNLAQLCSELKIDGHRGELTITRAAGALAAFERRRQVTEADVRRVAVMALRHRLRRGALEEAGTAERIAEALDQVLARSAGTRASNGNNETVDGGGRASSGAREKRSGKSQRFGENSLRSPNGNNGAETSEETQVAPFPETKSPRLKAANQAARESRPREVQLPSGRRQTGLTKAVYDRERGRYARSVSSSGNSQRSSRVAVGATVRALLSLTTAPVRPSQSWERQLTPVSSEALRFKLFKRKPGRLFIFALDLSGSMALNRIAQAKGLMIALLRQSYVKRDHVAIVGFRGTGASLVLPPTRSILRARRVLDVLGVGGGTPLSAGLECALALAKQSSGRRGEVSLLLFTDGRANVASQQAATTDRQRRQLVIEREVKLIGNALKRVGVETILIDTQNRYSANDEARQLAQALGADYQPLTEVPVTEAPRGWHS